MQDVNREMIADVCSSANHRVSRRSARVSRGGMHAPKSARFANEHGSEADDKKVSTSSHVHFDEVDAVADDDSDVVTAFESPFHVTTHFEDVEAGEGPRPPRRCTKFQADEDPPPPPYRGTKFEEAMPPSLQAPTIDISDEQDGVTDLPPSIDMSAGLTPFEEILEMEFATLKIRLLSQHKGLLAQAAGATAISNETSGRVKITSQLPVPGTNAKKGHRPPASPPPRDTIESLGSTDSVMDLGSDLLIPGGSMMACSSDLDASPRARGVMVSDVTEEYAVKGEKKVQRRVSGFDGVEEVRCAQMTNLLNATGVAGAVEMHAAASVPHLHRLETSDYLFGGHQPSYTVVDEIPHMKLASGGGGSSAGIGRRKSYLSKVSKEFKDGIFEAHPVWYVDYELLFPKMTVQDQSSMRSSIDIEDLTDEWGARSERFSYLVVMPNTLRRIFWDVLCITFNLYDIIVLPLSFFDLNAESHILLTIMAWITRVFWTLDIPASFITGYVTATGNLESRLSKIALTYAKGWLCMDLMIVSADWTEYILDATLGSGAARLGRSFRAIRTLRMVRLLRLVRMSQLFKRLTEHWLTDNTRVMATVFNIMLGILIVAHIVACVWYGIGLDAPQDRSWLSSSDPPLDKPGESKWYKYITSLLWSLSEITSGGDQIADPQALSERMFTIFLAVFAFIMSTAAVSMLTSSMTRFDLLTSKEAARFQALRQYMSDNHITAKLHVRVQRNAEHALAEKRRNIAEADVELLRLISEPLRVELHFQVYAPVLTEHPFFSKYCQDNPAAMMHICHSAVRCVGPYSRGDTLFTVGEVPEHPCMMFVLAGDLRYARSNTAPRELGEGEWCSEHTLWVPWRHCGTLQASEECRLLCISSDSFQHLVTRFFSTAKCVDATHPSKYAMEFVKRLNNTDVSSLSDLTKEDEVEEDVHRAFPANVRFDVRGSAISHRSGHHHRMSRVESAFTHGSQTLMGMFKKLFRQSPRGTVIKVKPVARGSKFVRGSQNIRISIDTAETFKHATRVSEMSAVTASSTSSSDWHVGGQRGSGLRSPQRITGSLTGSWQVQQRSSGAPQQRSSGAPHLVVPQRSAQ